MDNETLSFVAIGLMVLANFGAVFARKIQNKIIRWLISTVSFLLLIPSALIILIVLFT